MDEALESLRYHWEDAYAIIRSGDAWLAQRRDTREVLRAGSAEVLRALIVADYANRPVPRE